MVEPDQYIAAQPGLTLLEWHSTAEISEEPIIAWMIPGDVKRRSASDTVHFHPWPATLTGWHRPGEVLCAIKLPDGRVYEPGHHWHEDIQAWKVAERKRWDRQRAKHENRQSHRKSETLKDLLEMETIPDQEKDER
jgi:hypothetical protein